MMDQSMNHGVPNRIRRSTGTGIATVALSAVVALAGGCQADSQKPGPASDDWKNRSSTVGTDFNKVPPGQTISAPLGVDLP